MIDEDGQSLTDMEAVRFPLPSSHSDDPETAENRHPDRESNPSPAQSPATRSKSSQLHEIAEKIASEQGDLRVCHTEVSHFAEPKSATTLSNRSRNRLRDCSTRSSHQRSSRGVWRRGSVYQFRVKVPVDLRDALGREHVNRSLRTDSRSLAIRLSRKVDTRKNLSRSRP